MFLLCKDLAFNERVHHYTNKALAMYSKEGSGGVKKMIEELAKAAEASKKEAEKKANSGGSSGDKKDESGGPFSGIGWQKIAITIGVIIALQMLMEYSSYKEISWKEFYHDFLEQRKVDKLEVVDKRWVRVVTKDSGSQFTYYFNIGSVDSFERSLAAAQHHLEYEPDQQITVIYKSEFDLLVDLIFDFF